MVIVNLRGHSIYCNDGENWVMEDDSPINHSIECAYCGGSPNKEGHDNCIANLKGVKNACCGHGNIIDCYVQLHTGQVFYGAKAKEIIEKIKRDNKL